jgi:uncharacterized protein
MVRAHGKPRRNPPFSFGGREVAAGASETVELPISKLSTHTEMALPVRVVHGGQAGPVLFVSAAVHGDEVVGVEIIRRLLKRVSARRLAGTLICAPIVNVFGFVTHTRYLPDRRDLNRCFPGSPTGSLAAQLAHVFNEQIIGRSDYGIDLHSAALHRTNLAQIRIAPDRPRAAELARAFGAPAIITAPLRQGSLRSVALGRGVDVLLFEGGEALRFDELAIRVGVKGVLRVMSHLAMLASPVDGAPAAPIESTSTQWIRAPGGGIFRAARQTGDRVDAGDVLGYLSDPLGESEVAVRARSPGVVIGRTNLPVVNQGDALMHVAGVKVLSSASARIGQIADDALSDPLFDEDEVI